MPTNKRVPKWPCLAKIYKLWWRGECTDVYVGSTRRLLLCERMKGHRAFAKRGSTSPVYAAIRKNGPFEYDLLETVHCENYDEARTIERRWAEILDANLNMVRPICTKEERLADQAEYRGRPENKAKQVEYQKEYATRPENKAKKTAYAARPENKAKKTAYDARPGNKAIRKAYEAKIIRENRFSCEACAYHGPTQTKLTRHQKSKRHKKNTLITPGTSPPVSPVSSFFG